MTRLTWNEYFMNMAVLTAMRSADPSTKVGAVIVAEDNTVISTGYNGLPRGFQLDTEETMDDRPTKYKFVIHAEANAILNAGRRGTSLQGSTLYLTWVPCVECAKMIVQAGIARVFMVNEDNERWKNSFEQAMNVLMLCGVKVDVWLPSASWVELTRFVDGKKVV